jgi:biopolymer transport protein TolQ
MTDDCKQWSANSEIERLDSNLSILAMIASSSPYIGLFGTVWGIMHSFIGLASVKQASIAVVAPVLSIEKYAEKFLISLLESNKIFFLDKITVQE